MPLLSAPLCCQTNVHTAGCYAIDSGRGAYVTGSLAAVWVVFVTAVLSLLTGTTQDARGRGGEPLVTEATPLVPVIPLEFRIKAFRKRARECLLVQV